MQPGQQFKLMISRNAWVIVEVIKNLSNDIKTFDINASKYWIGECNLLEIVKKSTY